MTGRLKFVYVVTSMVAFLFLSSCQGEADSKKKEANSSQSTGVSAEEIAVNEGLDFFMVGKYEDAVEALTEVIRMYPEYYGGYYGRGLAYGRLNQFESAISDYDKALQLNYPNPSSVYNSRATLHSNLGRYELALRDLNKVIKLNPQGDANLSNAYYGRGMVYGNMGKYDEAERDFIKAKELGFQENIEHLLEQLNQLKTSR